MRRVGFLNSVRFWGGGEQLHLDHALAFRRFGYGVTVLADPDSALWARARAARLDTEPVRVRNLSFLNPLAVRALARTFRRLGLDTVVFSGSPDLKLGALAARHAGLARVVYLRGLAVPIRASRVNRYVFARCLTHVVANSEATGETILRHLRPYVDPARVHVVYHGVALPPHPGAAAEGPGLPAIAERAPRGLVIGNAGRLTPQKGQHYLVAVARLLRDRGVDATVFIAGTGELHDELARQIEAAGLEGRVVLLGFVTDVAAFMRSLDVFALTSGWEGFGFVLTEAMLARLPVVAFDVSSNPEVVAADETGLLVPYPDIGAFADALARLAGDAELRRRFGEAGEARVWERFSLERQVRALEACLLGEVPGLRPG